ncbi:MAG: PAS domain S-box protein [Proteobacteria bacterium]|nr:PAS domain S-box protein [Pseudomonadota bacterium]
MKGKKQTKPGLLSEHSDLDQKNSAPAKLKQKTPVFPSNEKQEWYHLLFNNISDIAFVNEWPDKTDFPGTFVEVNDAACEQLGYTKDELLLMTPPDIDKIFEGAFNESDIPKLLLKNKRAMWEGLVINKDGRQMPVEMHNRLFYKDNKTFILSTIRDVGDRKQAEEALKKSEEKYHELFEKANDAIYLTDADGNITAVNNKALELQGYSRYELIGTSLYNHISENNLPYVKKMIIKFKKNGTHDSFLANTLTKDGRTLIFELSASAIKDGDNYVGALTIVRDITDRIMAEKALRESEQRYRDLVEKSPNIIYSYSDKRGIIFCSSLYQDILGYSLEQFTENPFIWRTYIHPEDHYITSQVIKSFSEGKHFNVEYRIKDQQGKWHWFEDKSISIRKENNEFIANGLITEITERKMMEQEIRELSMRDQLTELYNRRGFITLAEQQLKSAKRTKRQMTLLFLDADDLKTINDTLGHEEGDKALYNTADILRQTFRESDIIARIGGDEFAVLVVDSTDMNSKIITQRLLQNINIFNTSKVRKYKLSLSWGTAIYDPDSTLTLDKLMSIADGLMYTQKRSKKNIKDNY